MNSNLFITVALLIGLVSISIALAIDYQRYKRANSRMLEQVQKIEQDWQTEFAKTPLTELKETEAGKQLLILEGISEESLISKDLWKVGDRIFYGDKEIVLSPGSHKLLTVLIEHGEEVVSKEEIAERVFESPNTVTEAALREAMRRLKRELKLTEKSEGLILFIPEQGFVLQQRKESEPDSKKNVRKPG